MVFVTHDQIEAMTMADRIVVLQSEIVQQYDTPEIVYERQAKRPTHGRGIAAGSPTMNFFAVELHGDAAAFANGGAPAPLDAAARARLKAAAGMGIIGVRPEHFAVVPTNPRRLPSKSSWLNRSDTLIHFEVAGTPAIARVDPSLKPKLGERLSLLPQPGKIHLFDAATGRILLVVPEWGPYQPTLRHTHVKRG